ncbi:tRNA pseudouridine(38-40) synthase TruA [Candidatus Protochlamydia phocaeensis]|uniref:tRNA pseudouridine(38-40) synthase TruA n=1 Tax=Candidatus Protochlamydia phocaeensis TaxID=1414722 RepID=UPI0008399E7E|nr:tRNA pseudouridine(38-40) synthase TruA [Candidatus Protochlamydia phocaeensis]
MQNIKLLIAYDGGHYLGWQKTPMGPSIEATLQQVLEQILQHPISLQAASRTDAGVHALGQVVNFLTSKPPSDFNRFIISLNSLLPKDLVVLSAERAPTTFHPTLDSIGKEYHYFICYGMTQLPHLRHYSWHCHFPLRLAEMRSALPYFIGTHNFAAFCNFKKNAHYTDYTREIQEISLLELEGCRLRFSVRGNHFLYKMVRNLVGTLVYIGKGKIDKEQIPAILSSEKRTEAGITAPAHGLFLHQVFYP